MSSATEADALDSTDIQALLAEYNIAREELESLAESDYQAAPVAKALLDNLLNLRLPLHVQVF